MKAGAGFFISVEGADKAGKTTQAARLSEWLRARGHDVVVTREPGGTPAGEAIRRIVLNRGETAVTPVAEVLLFAASRGQLVSEVIRPALSSGRVVVADRYIDSSLAYQAAGLGLDWDKVLAVNEWATGGLWPDLTILLDSPDPVLFQERPREGAADRIEKRNLEFHRLVSQAYRRLAQGQTQLPSGPPERFAIVDASRSEDEVALAVRGIVAERLRRREGPGP